MSIYSLKGPQIFNRTNIKLLRSRGALMELCHDVMIFLLYFIILLPGVKDLLYQFTLLEELRVQQKHKMKWSVETDEKEHQTARISGLCATKATYMCHKGIVDGGLWVTGPARLHCLPLRLRVGCCGLPIVVLEAWAGLLLWWRMVQDSCHTQLHLEVQKVIPGVFEEQILLEREMCSWVTCDMLQSSTNNKHHYV